MLDPECNKNVFQLWKENGEKLPFKVVRWTWGPTSYFIVEKVEVGKWPYGKAWGRFVRDDVAGGLQKMANAGSYQWKIIE